MNALSARAPGTHHRRMMKEFVLPVLIASSGCLPVLGQVLYDGSLGTAPAQQGWTTVSLPLPLATPVADSAVRLDTLALSGELSGFSRTAPSPLDRTNGFRAVFTLRLHEESHNTPDRAGLSVIVLGHDKRGLELAFWTDRVWAQSDTPMFKHAEEALFDTTAGFVAYELAISATGYTLRADGKELLAGPVRDYTPFVGAFDPYETPDFLFIGDDTTSAKAAFSLRRVEILPASAAPVLSFVASASGADPLTLTWPTGHKLQRATKISLADWQDAPGDPPLAVPLDGADGYFRVVPR